MFASLNVMANISNNKQCGPAGGIADLNLVSLSIILGPTICKRTSKSIGDMQLITTFKSQATAASSSADILHSTELWTGSNVSLLFANSLFPSLPTVVDQLGNSWGRVDKQLGDRWPTTFPILGVVTLCSLLLVLKLPAPAVTQSKARDWHLIDN
uniref:Uncharacterized protein n=1 Tax=Timema bartmani TaxID=61472 RepID=A0A7R9I203_9NEOP|nr:unnamed protein product [Timema bartmani]